PSRSDLYEVRPDDTATLPPGKLLGYFELSSSGTLTFTALAAPVVSTPPTDLIVTNYPGTTASFTAGVTGDGLGYQWSLNGTPLSDSAKISGSQTASLTLTNLVDSMNGTYSLLVQNDAGTATTSATLTIDEPTAITNSPVSSTINYGGT